MPERRLQKCREAYRCHRGFVLTPWPHCDCKACEYARRAPAEYAKMVLSRDYRTDFSGTSPYVEPDAETPWAV